MLKDKKVIVDMYEKIDRCRSDQTTKQSVLPIQISPVVEREVGSGGQNSKFLYSLTVDRGHISVEYNVNTKTGHSGIYTSFRAPIRRQSKMLYIRTQEGVQTATRCYVNLKTGYIGIANDFKIRGGWNGGAHTNPDCTVFLGVVVAEKVLSKVFKNVQRMPPNNPGYDFICGKGFKIDVKSACIEKNTNRWAFNIKRNQVSDYFLCLAFDNRKDLNPEHIWLIPGSLLNNLMNASIARSTLEKWSQYELIDKLDDVVTCCDTLKD